MEKIDLSSNSRKIQDAYDNVVNGKCNYVVYTVSKLGALDVEATGSPGDLDEFVDQFTDGHIQFGLARVTVPGSDVTKNLLLGWCPDNSPAKLKLSFATNFADVARVLSGYHIQITARDQEDLDVNDFINRVGAAAGARYSLNTGKAPIKSATSQSKPVTQAKSELKPVKPAPVPSFKQKPAALSKPSFTPKTTGKPIGTSSTTSNSKLPISSASKFSLSSAKNDDDDDDGWGDEKELEERDFDKKPLEDVPSAYKPTKVNIEELRKNKLDTISLTRKPFNADANDKVDADDSEPKSLAERMKAYKDNEDGRLTELPKPKVLHNVSNRFKPAESNSGPKFGAKPNFGSSNDRKDHLVGGLLRDFGGSDGLTPAQQWALKKGKYKKVDPDDIADGVAQTSLHDDEQPAQFTKNEEAEDEAEEEREVPIPPLLQSAKKSEPVRSIPPPFVKEDNAVAAPSPSLPTRDESNKDDHEQDASSAANNEGLSANAEYDHVTEEDDELAFEEGDVIIQIDTSTDEEWWMGTNKRTGKTGLFPANYVSLIESSRTETSASSLPSKDQPAPPLLPVRDEPAAPLPNQEEKLSEAIAIALYDYEKDEDNEIGFAEDDKIINIEFVDEDWWKGTHEKTGETGLFPSNFVELQN
ncbi:hypothetical protein JNB11_02220 [Kocuria palustris]|nr:hypothetical protein [Kocuria palustris]